MDPRESQCASWIGRNHRSCEENLRNTLDRIKSCGDQIQGGEGRESLGNPPKSGGETPNHLLVTLATCWKRVERRKGYIPRGPDLSGEETRLVRWNP
jgi:hypothetical protein